MHRSASYFIWVVKRFVPAIVLSLTLVAHAGQTAGHADTKTEVKADVKTEQHKDVVSSNPKGAIKVEIIQGENGYQLMRNGEQYVVRGAGLVGYDLKRLAAYGGNSVRTWTTYKAKEILDEAHALGMTVSLGLEFGKERQGFDYNNQSAVAEQFDRVKAEVLQYKDHPALLTWLIGNELNLLFENPAVFDAVNDVAVMIKQLDPNHPVGTPLAGFDTKALGIIEQRAPALDFISFQVYGTMNELPVAIEKYGFTKPYMMTDWGAISHRNVEKTTWGAPIEMTSSEKASNYAERFLTTIEPFHEQIIGNYVFLWGQKQERTDTWYGMFLESGERTETVDVMQFIWTEKWPINRSPRVSPIALNSKMANDNVALKPLQKAHARIQVEEPDGDDVSYRWLIREESSSTSVGGDEEYQPPLVANLIENPHVKKIKFTAPKQPGAYRLYVYVYDGNGNAGHANFPFFVSQ